MYKLFSSWLAALRNPAATSEDSTDACASGKLVFMAYFDGEEENVPAKEFLQHLADCPACARHRQEWQKLQSALRSLPTPVPPPKFSEQLIAHCRNAQPEPREILNDYLETAETDIDSFGELSGLVAAPPAPQQLREQILLAVGAERTSPLKAVWDYLSKLPVSRQPALRWSAALAFPALAACVILISQSQPPLLPSNSAESTVKTVAPAEQEKPDADRSSMLQPEEFEREETETPLITGGASKVLSSEVLSPKVLREEPHKAQTAGAVTERTRPRTFAANSETRLRTEAVLASSDHAVAAPQRISENRRRGKRKSQSNFKTSSFKTSSGQKYFRAERRTPSPARADLTVTKSAPIRIARTSPALVSSAAKELQPLPREAEPQISAPRAAPPSSPNRERFAASDFDETFMALLQERDSRPADLKRVFDEYHIALLTDDSDSPDDL